MKTLIQSILTLGSAALTSEAAACDALAALRFPKGLTCPHCRASCTRTLAHVVCDENDGHKFTLLVGTPLATKRRPRVQALFLAIRAFSSSHRSVSSRELARDVGMSHVTLWRHLHTLRALLRQPPLRLTALAEPVRVSKGGWLRVGAKSAMRRRRRRPTPQGNMVRIVGESVRTWLNGTFHGVSRDWLSLYAREICARFAWDAFTDAERLVRRLVRGGATLVFRRVQRRARR